MPLILIAALAAIAEIIPAFSGRPLFSRGAVTGSLVAIAVLGHLAWMQNMLLPPIPIGWAYFGMAMALASIVPFGSCSFNLIATMSGGAIQLRAADALRPGRDFDRLARPRPPSSPTRLVAVGWQLQNTTDATAATHYALVGGAVFGGFAALHYWFPKMTGRMMGESLAESPSGPCLVGVHLTFFPMFLAGLEGQLVDVYKYFADTGVSGLQPDRDDRLLRARRRDRRSRSSTRSPASLPGSRRARPVGRRAARVVRALTAPGPQLRRRPRRPQPRAAARHPRRDRDAAAAEARTAAPASR